MTLLPEPDSPTSPSVSPWPIVKLHVADGVDRAAAGEEVDLEVLDLEQRCSSAVARRDRAQLACPPSQPVAAAADAGAGGEALLALLRVERHPQPDCQEVDGEHDQRDQRRPG